MNFSNTIRKVKGFLYQVVAVAFLLSGFAGNAQSLDRITPAAILQELRSFREMGGVLYIGAHPDDENTQLLAYLARGRGCRTAYLSLTRGDGGQNVLGPELGEELGVIRTQELLAARRLDGARQFFTRAIDFGYSKDYRETLRVWNRQEVLADMVRIIRSYRPDVLLTRFSPESGGHGHHTASAVLAVEAFKLAGDPQAYPEQLGELTVWQPKRILLNGSGRGMSAGPAAGTVQFDVSGTDPQTSEPFSDIAGRSRSMHKTQGFGSFGGTGSRGARLESFQLLGGEPITKDIFDGMDTTWNRVSGGMEISRLVDEVIAKFDVNNPAAAVPSVLAIRSRLGALSKDQVMEEKRFQLDKILQACLGLSVETRVPQAEIVPGETLKLHHTVLIQSDFKVRWLAVRYSGTAREVKKAWVLRPRQAAVWETSQTIPSGTWLSQPYWLRDAHTAGMFRVENPALIGRPESPPVFPIQFIFEVGGQKLLVPDEPVQITSDPDGGEIRRRLDVISPVALRPISDVRLFTPGSSRTVEVEITALRAGREGLLRLDAPADWQIAPAGHSFHLAAVGERARFAFTVTAPKQPAKTIITAQAQIHGVRYHSQRVEIRYRHIPVLLLQPEASLTAVSFDLAIRGQRIGYLPGAGDRTDECLEQMGYTVTRLSGADLTPERLRGLDAVVIGIRAFNVRTDLASQLPALFAYSEAGGNVIVQYNNPNGLKSTKLAPFDLQLSQDRVTDENAEVTLLTPDHPALNVPNKIGPADFQGWVQERGLYFPNKWDTRFTPIIACGDPGETALKGGILIGEYGRGYFVYTGMAWFRQLPAGVPGAYRLFANLVSLGK